MRARTWLFGLVVFALLPANAFAVAPVNDSISGAVPLMPEYAQGAATGVSIAADGPVGGWADATTTEDSAMSFPTCLGTAGYHSMWYQVDVPESSVLKVALSSADVSVYKPLVTIVNSGSLTELACSLGGKNLGANQGVVASTFAPKGVYWIRIASAISTPTSLDRDTLPVLALSESLRDVTPPQISVAVSKTVGIGKRFTFDATASSDAASGVNDASAEWNFYEGGASKLVYASQLANPRIATHSWRTGGLHLVTLTLADNSGNKITYYLNVLVHSFVPPKASFRVLTPRPGASSVRIVLKHDMPVRIRLVVLQGGKLLRLIPSKTIKGRRSTTISIALGSRVAKDLYLAVSGTASDLSDTPNTVSLKTCTVHPGKAGGVCA